MHEPFSPPSAKPFTPIPEQPSQLIQVARLRERLPAWLNGWQLECVAETGSTNTDLLQLGRVESLHAGQVIPRVRQADVQTAGRGRLGRQWLSHQQDSLMFSVSLCVPRALSALGGLSLACGVAVVDAIEQYLRRAHGNPSTTGLGLKWPNDVLLNQRKLAGILLETAASQAAQSLVVIGIGLNLRRNAALEQHLGRSLAGLEELLPWQGLGSAPNLDATELLAELLQQLALRLDQFAQQGFAASRTRWMALDAYAGQTVNLLESGSVKHTGTACGVDEQGQLRLATAQGLVTILGGEVSLRGEAVTAPASRPATNFAP